MNEDQIRGYVATFGLLVDYSQWDVEGKEWIRIKDPDAKNNIDPLILWKENCDEPINALYHVTTKLREYLITVGEYNMKKKINTLISF